MTLSKQIIIVISSLVLLLLATSMYVNYKSTESFIRDQLLSNAENTASSLGVTLGHIAGDKALEETLINAVFDSGYYEYIILSNVDNHPVYTRENPAKIQGIPDWFVQRVRLRASEAVVPVSSNWRITGYLKVKGHRGHAYGELWQAFKEMIIGFVILGSAALIGIYLFLKIVLRPLKLVREQAEAVIRRRFIFQKSLPRTKELRDVVTAMNLLVAKVKKIYEKEAKAIADYTRIRYKDSETGYYNRAYFRVKMQDYLHASDALSHGHVLAFEIYNYPQILEEKGANGTHDAVMQLKKSIDAHCCQQFNEAVMCRTRENDMMIILPASRREDVEAFARSVCELSGSDLQLHCAFVSYEERESLTHVLKIIDSALMLSAGNDSDYIRLYADIRKDIPLLSHDEWVAKIEDVIQKDAFIPMLQPVLDENGKTVQNELLLRLHYNGKIISAGLFMPIIAGVHMLPELERYVLNLIERLPVKGTLAVNVTYEFISKSANLQTLTSFSKRWKRIGMDLIFEIPNTAVALDYDAVSAFAAHIQRLSWDFGIDHFTAEVYDLHLLEELKPAYLKINAGYLISLLSGSEGTAIRSSLLTICHLLDIDLIAIAVDSEQTAKKLRENGIKRMQGFWITEPREVKKNG